MERTQSCKAQKKDTALWGLVISGFFMFLLWGCATTPQPKEPDDLCAIFREHSGWYQEARKSYSRWGVPIPVMMAIMHQESTFMAKAKPPRTKCLWIFPGPRPSSAYGYAQATDETWQEYIRSSGNRGADRDEFEDAIDFVGWYCNLSADRCGISKRDAYSLYLAYHEGHGGFNRKTYKKKAWLMQVAHRVDARAETYSTQLASCERELYKRRPCCLWPF